MPEQVQVQINVTSDTAGAKEATSELGSFNDALRSMGIIAAGIALERLTEKIVDLGKEAAGFAISTAANFEQTAVSMGTILGSSEKAGALLKSLSDWEVHTPFDFSTITNAAKELLAFGTAESQVLPRLKELSDISMGDPGRLMELVNIYGEVNTLQKVSLTTVRRLSSEGIPIFDALKKVIQESGTAGEAMGSHIEKGTKMSATAVQNLQDKIKLTTDHLKVLNDTHVKAGIATERHNLAIETANIHLTEYQSKLSGANKVIQNVGGSADLSAQQIEKMMSAGEISPDMFNKALDVLTKKGGMFYQETIRQSHTFNGVMSSIHSQFMRLALDIMGVSLSGDIAKGGLFDILKQSAAAFLDFLQAHSKDIANFAKDTIGKLSESFKNIHNVIQTVSDVIKNNQKYFNDLRDILKFTGDLIKGHLITIWNELEDVYKRHKTAIDLLAKILGGTLLFSIIAIIEIIAEVIEASIKWVGAFFTVGEQIKKIAIDVANVVVGMINFMIDAINAFVQGSVNIVDKIPGVNISMAAIPHVPNVPTGSSSSKDVSHSLSPNNKGGASGVSITNNNTFNTPYDPTNFARNLGLQVSLAQH